MTAEAGQTSTQFPIVNSKLNNEISSIANSHIGNIDLDSRTSQGDGLCRSSTTLVRPGVQARSSLSDRESVHDSGSTTIITSRGVTVSNNSTVSASRQQSHRTRFDLLQRHLQRKITIIYERHRSLQRLQHQLRNYVVAMKNATSAATVPPPAPAESSLLVDAVMADVAPGTLTPLDGPSPSNSPPDGSSDGPTDASLSGVVTSNVPVNPINTAMINDDILKPMDNSTQQLPTTMDTTHASALQSPDSSSIMHEQGGLRFKQDVAMKSPSGLDSKPKTVPLNPYLRPGRGHTHPAAKAARSVAMENLRGPASQGMLKQSSSGKPSTGNVSSHSKSDNSGTGTRSGYSSLNGNRFAPLQEPDSSRMTSPGADLT